MRLYVGNLPYSTTDQELRTLFEEVGPVKDARVIKDRDTGRSKGFGFVEMLDSDLADKAMFELSKREFNGRPLVVNEAHERNVHRGGRSDHN